MTTARRGVLRAAQPDFNPRPPERRGAVDGPHLMSIISRLRKYVGERRAAPRYATHMEKALVVYVSLSDPKLAGARLVGYTRDVSETGMGLVLPELRIAGRSVMHPGRGLRLLLGLPYEPVEMRATAVRHVELGEGEVDSGYLVGVQIKEMSPADQTRYAKYLRSLAIDEV